MIYIKTVDGLCTNTDGSATEFDKCYAWDDDDLESIQDDADSYRAANGLVTTAMVFFLISLLCIALHFVPSLGATMKNMARYGTIVLFTMSFFFLLASLFIATDTDLTDFKTYPEYSLCSGSM